MSLHFITLSPGYYYRHSNMNHSIFIRSSVGGWVNYFPLCSVPSSVLQHKYGLCNHTYFPLALTYLRLKSRHQTLETLFLPSCPESNEVANKSSVSAIRSPLMSSSGWPREGFTTLGSQGRLYTVTTHQVSSGGGGVITTQTARLVPGEYGYIARNI